MNHPKTVLLIDDDMLNTGSLERRLPLAGFHVLAARTAQQGIELLHSRHPEMIVFDLDLPDVEGWQFCQRLRRETIAPLIILTRQNSDINRVLGLELGADDYLVKPVNYRELLARIKAIFRRIMLTRTDRVPQIQIGAVRLDTVTYKVYKHNQALDLRKKEFDLLHILMSRPGQVVSRAELMDKVWGVDWLGDTRTLDVHIRWVREKIEESPSRPQYLQTVRRVGYRFIAPGEMVQ